MRGEKRVNTNSVGEYKLEASLDRGGNPDIGFKTSCRHSEWVFLRLLSTEQKVIPPS